MEENAVKIKTLPSVIDPSNKRLRILKAKASPMLAGTLDDTILCKIAGKKIAALAEVSLFDRKYFYLQSFICLIGLAFGVVDITTASFEWSVLCALMLPWSFLTFSLSQSNLLSRILRSFNTYFLLLQIAGLMICIGLISERPLMTAILTPTLSVSLFVDALPRKIRWRAAAFIHFYVVMFILAFDISLFASLFPVEDALSFTLNDMEFSGKALGFGCSINLLIFFSRNVFVLLRHPNCLLVIASNFKTEKLPDDSASVANAAWNEQDNDSLNSKTLTESSNHRKLWIIRPRHQDIVLRTKETIAAKVFGHGANMIFWKMARNPLFFFMALPAVICVAPLFNGDWPAELSLFSFVGYLIMIPSISILNAHLMKMLFGTFQAWFLLAMSMLLMTTWMSDMLDFRLISVPIIFSILFFSITLDAYPPSGRFLAGCRFYLVKLSAAAGIACFFLFTSAPTRYFSHSVGEVTFSGSALCLSAVINLGTFGLRNTFQLFAESDCLVILTCLMEYVEVHEDEARRLGLVVPETAPLTEDAGVEL